MAVKAGVQVMRKEDEKLKELKMKEEKNNEKVKKIKAERQMRLEENKRKRQEKMEQAELKRQKLEKEKQLQLKKFAKPEVSMSTANQTKSADRRKCDDDVEEISETKLSAKTEREDIGKKFENHKTNVDTSSELNVTKVVHKAEDRSNGLTEKHPKHPLGALNETVTVSKSTPPSAPLKSKLIESQLKTPANASPLSSYEMTPIQDSDSDDEKQRDRSKKIPSWAQGCLLRTAVINQNHEGRDPNEIFGSVIESPNLEKIFCRKIPCYKRRTSSQFWESIPD
ncbi:inner centromere protein-like [Uloborus diversus]|uniref:inner centromere protein-like n=1 Tax=Uloborus diversus TaxID=327109 RepID=UPI00240999D9|nr:inner centromere protein-like [Uloborus diversus]